MFNMWWRNSNRRRTERSDPVRKRTRPAVEQLECRTVPSTLFQLTSAFGAPGSRNLAELAAGPSIDGAGDLIAFSSDRNLTGQNADGNQELFVYSTTNSAFAQITSSVGGQGSYGPKIDAAGDRIVFTSDGDLTGHNADRNAEIFLFDKTTPIIIQVTNSSGGLNRTLAGSINADGSRFVFSSDRDLTGQNADGGPEIFLYDLNTSTLSQITNAPGGGGSFGPLINAAGNRIAFYSTHNLTGLNGDFNSEVFLYDTTTGTTTQITSSIKGHGSLTGSMSADGTRIAFYSDRNLTGGNPSGTYAVFLYDTTTGTTTQITAPVPTIEGSWLPSLNAAGTRVAFVSNGNLTGQNPDGNKEIFVYDTATGSTAQVTSSVGVVGSMYPALDADGNRIAFLSDGNLTGQNPAGNVDLFLARVPLAARDFTQQVVIQPSPLVRLGRHRYRMTLLLRARGKKTVLPSPLALVFNGLPAGMRLLQGSGLTLDQEPWGRPYRLLTLKGNRLTGKKDVRLSLTFFSPTGKKPRCSIQVMEAVNPL
jgi:Tol biopolymer transport system component